MTTYIVSRLNNRFAVATDDPDAINIILDHAGYDGFEELGECFRDMTPEQLADMLIPDVQFMTQLDDGEYVCNEEGNIDTLAEIEDYIIWNLDESYPGVEIAGRWYHAGEIVYHVNRRGFDEIVRDHINERYSMTWEDFHSANN